MKSKDLALRIAGSIFGIVAFLNLLRIVNGISITFDTWALPIWINVVDFFATGFLCAWLWWLSFGKPDDSPQQYGDKYTYLDN